MEHILLAVSGGAIGNFPWAIFQTPEEIQYIKIVMMVSLIYSIQVWKFLK